MAQMPSEITDHLGRFDRFASVATRWVSRAPFFATCVLVVAVWPICFFMFDVDTAQLIINTTTTIVTFLLVALLQNSQYRSDAATQHKLNAIAQGINDVLAEFPNADDDQRELTRAVGLESLESSTD